MVYVCAQLIWFGCAHSLWANSVTLFISCDICVSSAIKSLGSLWKNCGKIVLQYTSTPYIGPTTQEMYKS